MNIYIIYSNVWAIDSIAEHGAKCRALYTDPLAHGSECSSS